jgi:hypothetical protein
MLGYVKHVDAVFRCELFNRKFYGCGFLYRDTSLVCCICLKLMSSDKGIRVLHFFSFVIPLFLEVNLIFKTAISSSWI